MNWITPYQPAIASQSAKLQQHGFSWIGQDDTSVKFTDGEISLTFSVERYDDSLSAWVEYLGENSGDQKFRLDVVMRLMAGTTLSFVAHTLQEKEALVRRYIDFVVGNKTRLFGPTCPFIAEYENFNRQVGLRALQQFAKKP